MPGVLDPNELVRAIAPLNPHISVRITNRKKRTESIGADEVPYSSNDELPDAVKKLSAEEQTTWRKAFNGAYETYKGRANVDGLASATAWKVVRGAALDELDEEHMAKEGDPGLLEHYQLHTGSRRLMLFPRGEFTHPEYGRMVFDDTFFNEIRDNYQRQVLGQTKPFIDVDHNHGAAAGWIEGLSIEPDGLYANVDWTQFGEEKIHAGEYRYFSPWWGAYRDPSTGTTYNRVLRGGALTNIPFLKVLPPVQLYEPGVNDEARAAAWKSGRTFMLSEITRTGGASITETSPTLAEILRDHRDRQLVRALGG